MQASESSALVLIADDNPVNLELLSDALIPEGHLVAVASDGEEVLDILRHAKPDLILLDALMPGLDGFETCRRLKADPTLEGIPVIFMTSLNESHYRVEGFNVGAVDYVTKPFERAELLARVRAQISLRKATLRLKEKNSELETTIRELENRTEELRQAHEHIVKLEKQATEVRMAGGFAHEMRNALASAQLRLAVVSGPDQEFHASSLGKSAQKLNELYALTQEHLEESVATRAVGLLVSVREAEQKVSTALTAISMDIERALHVTGRILAYSRQGFERTGTDPIDVEELINNVVRSVEQRCAENQIKISLDVDPGCILLGNEHHFFSILSNLVLNSQDAILSLSEERERNIDIKLKQNEGHVLLQVTDTGVGIEQENQSRIFEPFYSTKPNSGTGLGLSMVEKLVLLYSGTIEVQSEPARGTAMGIRIPSRPHAS